MGYGYLLFGLMLIIIVAHQNVSAQDIECAIQPSSPRKVNTISADIIGIWAKDFDIDHSRRDTLATIADVFIVAKSCGEVVAFDANTGEIIWRADGIVNPSDLTTDEINHLVFFTGLEEVRALSADSGEIIWSTTSYLFERTAISTDLLIDGRLVVDVVGRGRYFLDNEQGILGDQIELPPGTRFYDGNFTIVTSVDEIRALESQTDSELWSFGDLSGSWAIDVFAEDNLLTIRWHDTEPDPGIIAISLSTGEMLWHWQEGKLASNLESRDGNVYFLTAGAELVVLDLITGLPLNNFQFVEQSRFDDPLQNSQLVVRNSSIGIYFQDRNNFSVYKIVAVKSGG